MQCPEEMVRDRPVVALVEAVVAAGDGWEASPWGRAAVVSVRAVDTRWPTSGERPARALAAPGVGPP